MMRTFGWVPSARPVASTTTADGEKTLFDYTSGLLAQVFRRDNQPLLANPAAVLGGTGEGEIERAMVPRYLIEDVSGASSDA